MSFADRGRAEKAYNEGPSAYIGKGLKKVLPSRAELAKTGRPILDSVSVDAACSGNPGDMEYRGVNTRTGEQLFHRGPYARGTVNIGEFLAIVHALALLKRAGSEVPVYSDSRTAIKWVRDKKSRTKLEKTSENSILFEFLERAEKWLKENDYPNTILKWETAYWGEIPADFGRK